MAISEKVAYEPGAGAPVVLGCHRRGGAWVVELTGELDLDAVPQVRAAADRVIAAGGRRIVLDTRSVTFADSSSLNLLLQLNGETHLCLAAPSEPVRRLLDITGASAVLRTTASLGEALDALGL
ncbi:STAS domain-containing protein [Streptomyces sp. LP05-1]|uniref:Anti-sigma factor antagonist n=1 Tax=Streptomyces pyxinae TaxID=2970734 RepID=A0ABT2CDW6_9ACTN|nr:STAS domain-containing protein [Streptomyces sp. LP05-1]MCS0634834.1 STAS domain-containing protein [Streptomyces sp. LP05-1]